jgi:hypothetical protein
LKGIRNDDDSCGTIYINTNEHYRAVETETRSRLKWWKEISSILSQKQPILQRIRSVKK